jgi:periplasmic divalent cation tolerance protein
MKLAHDFILALVTTANKQEAELIVETLQEKKLIACANILGPVLSLFEWSGKLERVEECLILLKSHRDLTEKLAEAIRALHSYEVPEIIFLPIVGGSESYLNWLTNCLISQE